MEKKKKTINIFSISLAYFSMIIVVRRTLVEVKKKIKVNEKLFI